MRSVITMLVVVLLLGGFWYFHDIRGSEQKREEQRLTERVFPEFDSKDIKAMVWSDGAATPETVRRFVRQNLGWVVEIGENKFRADGTKLNGLADSVAELSRQEVILEKPGQEALAQFGLDKPTHRLVVEYTDKSGHDGKATLFVGKSLIDDSGSYARLEGKDTPVLSIVGSFIPTFMSLLDELRERNLFAFAPAQIRTLRYESYEGAQPGVFTLKAKRESKDADKEEKASFFTWGQDKAKETLEDKDAQDISEDKMNEAGQESADAKWYISDPKLEGGKEIRADLRTCNDFVWSLQGLQVNKFLYPDDTTPIQAKSRLTIEVEGIKEPFVFVFGQPVRGKSGLFYASRNQPDERFWLDCKSLEEGLKLLTGKRSLDFIDRHVVDISLDEVQRFEVSVASKRSEGPYKVVAERSKGGWSIISPSPVLEDKAKQLEIADTLLYSLVDLQWESKLDKSKSVAHKEPVATFKLYTGEKGEVETEVQVFQNDQKEFWLRLPDGSKVSLAKDPRYAWIKACEDLTESKVQSAADAKK
ncbi:TPA: hypothetical protein DD394_03920 [bacterium UBP9_UBA11836]|nr:hypothetical protein [bacterium UBP9_UBA11836]